MSVDEYYESMGVKHSDNCDICKRLEYLLEKQEVAGLDKLERYELQKLLNSKDIYE